MFGYPNDGGPPIPLCLDCALKYDTLMESQIERIERQLHHIADQAEAAVGFGGWATRPPPRARRTVIEGPTTLHNIHISGGNVGVVNSGTIGRIDSAVGSMARGGEAEGADAIRKLTEAVAGSTELSEADKKKVLDNLSVVASEATVPKEERRGSTMLAVVENAATILEGATALWEFASTVLPAIRALFG